MRPDSSAAMSGIGVLAAALLLAGPIWQHANGGPAQAAAPVVTSTAPAPIPAPQAWTVTATPSPASATAGAAAPAAVPNPGSTPAATPPATASAPVPPAATSRPSREKIAYLTFDDGPRPPYTDQILDILHAHGATATFFMIGEEAALHPATVRAVRAAGHAVGNHSYTHPALSTLPAQAVRSEITRTDALLAGPVTCLRPPGGEISPAITSVAKEQGKAVVKWTVDTDDWRRPGTPAIIKAALRPPDGGAAAPMEILMHDGGGDRSQTVAALPTILDQLTKAGYTFAALPACG